MREIREEQESEEEEGRRRMAAERIGLEMQPSVIPPAPVSSSSLSSSSTGDHHHTHHHDQERSQQVVTPAIGTSSSLVSNSSSTSSRTVGKEGSPFRAGAGRGGKDLHPLLVSNHHNFTQYSTHNINFRTNSNQQQVYHQPIQTQSSNTTNNNCANHHNNSTNGHYQGHYRNGGHCGQQQHTYSTNGEGGHNNYNYHNSNGTILPHSQSFIMSTTDSSSVSSQSIPRNPFQELDPLPVVDNQPVYSNQQPCPAQVDGQASNNQGNQSQSKLPAADHGFPEKFYLALREIFDVLDDKKSGLLPVSEIESRWDVDDESSMFTPKGLMDCLRKVAPADGMINFDRFCAAIKICLLENNQRTNSSPKPVPPPKSQSQNTSQMNGSRRRSAQNSDGANLMKSRSASVPVPEVPSVGNEDSFKKGLKTYIKPAHIISVPHLQSNANPVSNGQGMKRVSSEIPAKPERQSVINQGAATVPRAVKAKSSSKGMIIKTLKSWKDNVLDKRIPSLISPLIHHSNKNVKSPPPSSQEIDSHVTNGSNNSSGSDMELPTHFQPIQRSGNFSESQLRASINTQLKASSKSRRTDRERRSTVGVTSVDYNQLKRMTLLQHEKDLLLRGLQAVDRTRDWYMKQMNLIQEKIRICGRGGFNSTSESFEVLQEKLQFKANRIINANQHLVALMDEANFPIHMNLAFKPLLAPHSVLPFNDLDSLEAQRLQEQNHVLSTEVANKQQVINKLTRERQTLLELLHSRTPVNSTIGTGTPVQSTSTNNSMVNNNNGYITTTNQQGVNGISHTGANCAINGSNLNGTNSVNGLHINSVNSGIIGTPNGMPKQEQTMINTSVLNGVNCSQPESFNQSNVTNYIDDSPYV